MIDRRNWENSVDGENLEYTKEGDGDLVYLFLNDFGLGSEGLCELKGEQEGKGTKELRGEHQEM